MGNVVGIIFWDKNVNSAQYRIKLNALAKAYEIDIIDENSPSKHGFMFRGNEHKEHFECRISGLVLLFGAEASKYKIKSFLYDAQNTIFTDVETSTDFGYFT